MTACAESGLAAPYGPTRRAFAEGARDITPMVISVVPFALAIGATIGNTDLGVWAGIASAAGILAGAAQLTTVEMLDAGVAPFVIIASALIVNLRIALYSAGLAPWFAEQPTRRKLLLAVPIIDQMYFTCVPRFERGDLTPAGRVGYYAGAGSFLLASWIGAQALAISLGARLPEQLHLEIAAPLVLAGIVARSTATRSQQLAALIAGVLAFAGRDLPLQSGLLVAVVGAVGIVVVRDRRRASAAAEVG